MFVSIVALSALLQAQHTLASKTSSCDQTAQMRIYSSAFVHAETGDVLGYELAIKENDDSVANALLYVYEGAPNDEGIPLSGRISGKNLTIQGNWVEHLVEYPSKREIIQTHFIKIDGTLDANSFRGKIKIENTKSPDTVRLKRVNRIWLCKK